MQVVSVAMTNQLIKLDISAFLWLKTVCLCVPRILKDTMLICKLERTKYAKINVMRNAFTSRKGPIWERN